MFKKISLNTYKEYDGTLSVIEDLSFVPSRIFYIYDVPNHIERANHASANSKFVFIVVKGTVTLVLDDGINEEIEFTLNDCSEGIYVSELTWIRCINFSNDAILQVLAEKKYSDCEYITDKMIFQELVNSNRERNK